METAVNLTSEETFQILSDHLKINQLDELEQKNIQKVYPIYKILDCGIIEFKKNPEKCSSNNCSSREESGALK